MQRFVSEKSRVW